MGAQAGKGMKRPGVSGQEGCQGGSLPVQRQVGQRPQLGPFAPQVGRPPSLQDSAWKVGVHRAEHHTVVAAPNLLTGLPLGALQGSPQLSNQQGVSHTHTHTHTHTHKTAAVNALLQQPRGLQEWQSCSRMKPGAAAHTPGSVSGLTQGMQGS